MAGGSKDPNGREARLGAALRENLRRRKAQARGRADVEPPDASAPSKSTIPAESTNPAEPVPPAPRDPST